MVIWHKERKREAGGVGRVLTWEVWLGEGQGEVYTCVCIDVHEEGREGCLLVY